MWLVWADVVPGDEATLCENSSGNGPLRLTVLGTGYLGITHAACMASLGFDVLGVDIDAGKVDQLNAGQLPIYEPGLRELLRSELGSGRLAFTTSYRARRRVRRRALHLRGHPAATWRSPR